MLKPAKYKHRLKHICIKTLTNITESHNFNVIAYNKGAPVNETGNYRNRVIAKKELKNELSQSVKLVGITYT